jgi:polysaccharide export outer membrane protein
MKACNQKANTETFGNSCGQPGSVVMAFMVGVMALGILAGCSSGGPVSSKSTALAGSATYSRDVLREGDIISIRCESVTNINTVAKIPLNGLLDLPFIGQVPASGKTTQQLEDDLLELYSKQVLADVITVKLVQSSSAVYVVGAVLQPGKIPMDRPMTVLEAVMEAGGYDPLRAKLSKVAVVRLEDGQQMTYRIDLGKVLAGHDPTPFYLKPFDTVQVPIKTWNW